MEQFATPQEYLYHRERHTADVKYLHQPVDGRYRTYTWGEAIDHARRLVTALKKIGVQSGEPVAILSKNCAEWFIADYALIIGGYVSVPIYATASETTIGHILEHSEARAIFVGKLDLPDAQARAIPPEVVRIGMPYPTMEVQHRWDELLESDPFAESPVPAAADVMTILYTSGSTGRPKGAVHSFHNFIYAGRNIGQLLKVTAEERLLSYLPLAHCTERAYVEASTLIHGGQLWFVEALETFAENLRDCTPTFFGSVPRLWKQFQLRVLEQVPQSKLDRLLPIPLLGGLVRRKIKRALGIHNARWFMSGSAPIAPALLDWWRSVGVPIAEGWGMTETLAYGTLLPYGDEIRQGSIGKAATGTEIRFSDQGELEIRTPPLMSGYFKDPEQTAATITADGFLRTGDRGDIDADGYIRITGRVKDIYKTAKGKYVAPVPIEALVARNPFVEQVCLIGAGLRAPVALVQLNASARRTPRDDLVVNLEESRRTINERLESHERIERFVVVSAEWSAENGLLTPTLKIRRHELEARYRSLVERAYAQSVVFESG